MGSLARPVMRLQDPRPKALGPAEAAGHASPPSSLARPVVRLQDLLKAPVYIEHRIEAHPHDQRSVTSLYVHKARLRVNITTVI